VLELFEPLRVYLLIVLYFLDFNIYGLLDECRTRSIAKRISHQCGSRVAPKANSVLIASANP